MELKIYFYKKVTFTEKSDFWENFILQKFGAIQYIAYYFSMICMYN